MRSAFIIMVVGCLAAFLLPVVLRGNTKLMSLLLIAVAFAVYIKGNEFSTKFAYYIAQEEKEPKVNK